MDNSLILRRICPDARSPLKHNGPAVEGVNVGGVSPSGYVSRCFSQRVVPADKPPWRNFCKSRRKIKLSRLQDLSRAEVTNLAEE